MIKLSIIIVNWNTSALLKQCLNSLKSEILNPKFETEIIVVDNGSTDGSQEMVKKFKTQDSRFKIQLIESKENQGFSKGNNIGIKQAKGECIMLLNSDTIVKKGSIEKLIEFLDANPGISIVGPKLLGSDGMPQANCGRFPSLPVVFVMLFKEHFGGSDFVRCSLPVSGEVDWLMGAAFMARKKVFDKIGGLDEEIFMYMEEVEWFYRARKLGFKAWFFKDSEIVHLGRGSSRSGKKEPIINIYKGLLHYYKKHRSKTEIALLKLMLKTKAILALLAGCLKKDNYLTETYGQTIKID